MEGKLLQGGGGHGLHGKTRLAHPPEGTTPNGGPKRGKCVGYREGTQKQG